MKCKECDSCRKGFFKSQPDAYVCIGVKNPFVVEDINYDCTEYPEKNEDENLLLVGGGGKDGEFFVPATGKMIFICKWCGVCQENTEVCEDVRP